MNYFGTISFELKANELNDCLETPQIFQSKIYGKMQFSIIFQKSEQNFVANLLKIALLMILYIRNHPLLL